MNEAILTELLKLSVPTALLGLISYTLWKRFDARVKQNEQELRELRTRYDNEIIDTRGELKEILHENTMVMQEIKSQAKATNTIMARCANVMDCLTQEIKKVKPDFVNKHHS